MKHFVGIKTNELIFIMVHFELSEMIHNVVYIQVVVYAIKLEIRLRFRLLTLFVTFQLQSFKVLDFGNDVPGCFISLKNLGS